MSATAKLIKEAETALESNNLTKAIESSTLALEQSPDSLKSFKLRSQAYLRSKKYDEALADSIQGLKFAEQKGKRECIGNFYKQNAMVYFKMKQYDAAFEEIVKSEKYNSNDNEASIFKGMVVNKLKKLGIEDSVMKLKEKRIMESAASINGSEKTTSYEESKPHQEQSVQEKVPVVKSNPIVSKPPAALKVDWFDTNTEVNVSLFMKNIVSESLKVELKKNSVFAEFKTKSGEDFKYEVNPLFDEIDTEKSSYRLFGTKLELYWTKTNPVKWQSLELNDSVKVSSTSTIPKDTETTSKDTSALSYPSSSTKKINWSNFDVGDVDEKDDSDPNAFFKALYGDADDDTRRAMMKSYIESNGTALSTDWKEVGKGTTETTPPDGLEARKW
ncbi:hypothetical protein CANARDRAFT_29058 [[Candida] arabinofermentans NRRL YB-2248]|uniref:SGS domain-containing protein n=1 Tax=[Candida] arabinofermentans NRRL YB-2248 TaxID=983967 RepID=A0A1E4SYE8_9ASCO|nr:hypothetical protein CANARDRAFT_29058 [[Candida] arabinofermentans NRRL YB-2248]